MAAPELETKNLAEYGNIQFKAGVINTHEGGEDVYVSRTFMEDSPYDIPQVPIDFATSGNNTIIAAPGAGKKLRIYKVLIVADEEVRTHFTYYSGSTAKSGPMQVDILADPYMGGIFMDCGENEAFIIHSSNPGQVGGYVCYREVDV